MNRKQKSNIAGKKKRYILQILFHSIFWTFDWKLIKYFFLVQIIDFMILGYKT